MRSDRKKEAERKEAEQKLIDEAHQKKCKTKFLKVLERILENKFYTAFMTIITIFALFGDDIRLLIFPKVVDDYFYGMSTACLVFFSIEIIMASLSKEGYFLGFYFWLDLVSTISLVTDIGWFMSLILGD